MLVIACPEKVTALTDKALVRNIEVTIALIFIYGLV
jgi:hypothetical protein